MTDVLCPVCQKTRDVVRSQYTVKRCRPCANSTRNNSLLLRDITLARESYVDEVMVARLLSGRPCGVSTRAERQVAVHKLLQKGWSCKRIASWLQISERTVQRLAKRPADEDVDILQLTG